MIFVGVFSYKLIKVLSNETT